MATTQLPLCRALLAAVLAVTVLAATTASADLLAGECCTWPAACAERVAWAKQLGCLPAFLAGGLSWRPAALRLSVPLAQGGPGPSTQAGAFVLAVWAGRRLLPGVSRAPPGDQGGGLVPRSGRPAARRADGAGAPARAGRRMLRGEESARKLGSMGAMTATMRPLNTAGSVSLTLGGASATLSPASLYSTAGSVANPHPTPMPTTASSVLTLNQPSVISGVATTAGGTTPQLLQARPHPHRRVALAAGRRHAEAVRCTAAPRRAHVPPPRPYQLRYRAERRAAGARRRRARPSAWRSTTRAAPRPPAQPPARPPRAARPPAPGRRRPPARGRPARPWARRARRPSGGQPCNAMSLYNAPANCGRVATGVTLSPTPVPTPPAGPVWVPVRHHM